MKKYWIFFVFSLLISCGSKDEQDTATEPTMAQLLTAHDWHGVEVIRYVNGNASTHTSIASDVFQFKTDQTYTKTHAGNIVQNGTWELFDNTSIPILRLRYFSSSLNHNVLDDLTIKKITGDKFEFSMPVIDGSNDVLRDDYFFKK